MNSDAASPRSVQRPAQWPAAVCGAGGVVVHVKVVSVRALPPDSGHSVPARSHRQASALKCMRLATTGVGASSYPTSEVSDRVTQTRAAQLERTRRPHCFAGDPLRPTSTGRARFESTCRRCRGHTAAAADPPQSRRSGRARGTSSGDVASTPSSPHTPPNRRGGRPARPVAQAPGAPGRFASYATPPGARARPARPAPQHHPALGPAASPVAIWYAPRAPGRHVEARAGSWRA